VTAASARIAGCSHTVVRSVEYCCMTTWRVHVLNSLEHSIDQTATCMVNQPQQNDTGLIIKHFSQILQKKTFQWPHYQ